MDSTSVIVLAAGVGNRMRSEQPKVLFQAWGEPMIVRVLKTASALAPEKIIVITGHKKELVEAAVSQSAKAGLFGGARVEFAFQAAQRGTGDAVRSALGNLKGFKGTVLILYGDVPLVSKETLAALLSLHSRTKATITTISFKGVLPSALGRIIRDHTGKSVAKIVEAKDCSAEELLVNEFNSGIYAVDSAFLVPAVSELKNDNKQQEFYLTDIVERAVKEGQTVSSLLLENGQELLGVNTPAELSVINRVIFQREVVELSNSGVEISDPESFFMDPSVEIAAGAKIGPNVQLLGKTKIGSGVSIEGTAYISNSEILDGATLKLGVRIEDSVIGRNASVGPFAHLRPGTVLGEEVKIGNFVETKKAVLAKGAKASHLTYLGDCKVGEEANIGAGTITCNYDGYNKFETVIGKGAFIGSNSSLIAPVTIGAGATVGAGSAISKDVPADSLAITRASQLIKEGWSKAKRDKASKNR